MVARNPAVMTTRDMLAAVREEGKILVHLLAVDRLATSQGRTDA
jgi:hypothetical protein